MLVFQNSCGTFMNKEFEDNCLCVSACQEKGPHSGHGRAVLLEPQCHEVSLCPQEGECLSGHGSLINRTRQNTQTPLPISSLIPFPTLLICLWSLSLKDLHFGCRHCAWL